MTVNGELFQLEDQRLRVAEMIKKSKTMAPCFKRRQSMKESAEVCQLKEASPSREKVFENIMTYDEYAPDYHKKKCTLRKAEGQLGLDEHVAASGYSETQLQSPLDQIVRALAEEVSNEIKIDADSPFFEAKKHFGCGGNCHAS